MVEVFSSIHSKSTHQIEYSSKKYLKKIVATFFYILYVQEVLSIYIYSIYYENPTRHAYCMFKKRVPQSQFELV